MDQRRARVLVVDDDPKMGSVIRRALAAEHDVLVLTGAHQALEVITGGEPFDLILCDLSMPVMDGITFYERLGALAPALVERVVIMTGGACTPRSAAFLADADVARLEKPFSLAELRRVVREPRRGRVRGES